MKNLWTKFLVLVGVRSKCCGARLYTVKGWGREYCESCDRKVSG